MGQEIVYCHECQSRLVGSEFEKGKAFRIQNQNYCLPCAQKLLNSLPPHERDAFAAHMTAKEAKKSTQRIPIVQDPRARTGETGRHAPVRADIPRTGETGRHASVRADIPRAAETGRHGSFRPDSTNARMATQPPRAQGRSPLLWFGLGGGALALIGILVAVASSSGRPGSAPAGSPPTTSSSRDLPAPGADVRVAEARKLLEAAKAYAASNPGDAIGQIDRYSKAAWHAPGSPVAEAAQTEIDAIRRRSRERQQRELAELDRQVMSLTSKKDFAAAERLLEAAKGRHLDTEWSLAVKRRLADVVALQGGRRTDPSNPPPPPPPPPPSTPGSPPIVIYDDGLQNGWLNHSWASEVDFSFTGQKAEGARSIRWWPKENSGGLYLGPSLEQPLAGLTGITFALYGLEPHLPVTIGIWTDEKPHLAINLQDLGVPSPGQWKTYVLSFKTLNLRGRLLTGFVIQSFRQSNNAAPLLCVDAISLLRATPDGPSGAAVGW
ncbi:MAG TPA: hypothetical protein VEJ18_05030, partial [Planctomycetota bacterium]|nr:hypothetical protein [Planctomycetota bacterium]